MALKVRDEGDILEANLRFHHALGVDHFVVTDNGSTDETPEILHRYADAGLAHVINEPDADLREGGAGWLTRHGPVGRHGARGRLGDPHGRRRVLVAAARHARGDACRDSGSGMAWWSPRARSSWDDPTARVRSPSRLTVRESRARLQPKVAHRAEPDVVVLDRGGHDVALAGPGGDVAETLRPPGRPVHRTIRDAEGSDTAPAADETRLVWAPRWPLRILHFPVRSSAQFKRRTEIAIFEGRFPDRGRFRRLREQFEEGRLEELYAELLWDDAALDAGIRDGRLVRDERLARLLPECPDPLNGAPAGSVRVEPEPDELQREEAELEFDAMQLLGRTERWLMVQRERDAQAQRGPAQAQRSSPVAA